MTISPEKLEELDKIKIPNFMFRNRRSDTERETKQSLNLIKATEKQSEDNKSS